MPAIEVENLRKSYGSVEAVRGVSFEVAEELESIGRSLELEAKEIAAKMQAAAYQICYPGLSRSTQPMSALYQQLVSARLI